jgi:glucosamine 6-phosphate synthetase-like amidotransferase/phosphosugar isomerase protein
MCGQVGLILGRKRRTKADLADLRILFELLLLHSEVRGPHATGIAWLKTGGFHRIYKEPQPANDLVKRCAFRQVLADVDSDTTLLMGHTRWSTRGDPANNRNNHPLRAGVVIGTHNGTIFNADHLFQRFGLPRFAEVDSEVLFRMADLHTPEDAIDPVGFLRGLKLFRGQISAVMASILDPTTILVLKGNKPLSLCLHRQRRVVAYASEQRFLDAALGDEPGWRYFDVPEMTLLTLRHDGEWAVDMQPIDFISQTKPSIHDHADPKQRWVVA